MSALQFTGSTASVDEHRCGVIDIGSNSVRLVVYRADDRVPWPLIDEKIQARLGKALQADGRLPDKAMDVTLRALARFARLAAASGVSELFVVATAAVRDASNGPEFLDRVRALGLSPVLLSGTEEAATAARGVLCAFPAAEGIVADLGGGSLELVELVQGEPGKGTTLPLGTLRLAAMRAGGQPNALRQMGKLIERAKIPRSGEGRPLYIAGGSWRALAQVAIHDAKWTVRSPHGYVINPAEVPHLVNVLAHTQARNLQKVPGLNTARIGSLGDAALLLAALVRRIRPSAVVVSTFGLREGLIHATHSREVRREDPLLADLAARARSRSGWSTGPLMAQWCSGPLPPPEPGEERLRIAACWLAHGARVPDRARRRAHVLGLALDEKYVGIDAAGRAWLAAALLAHVGERDVPAGLTRLTSAAAIEQAATFGAIMRFAEKFSAGLAAPLEDTALVSRDGRLVLDVSRAPALFNEVVEPAWRNLGAKLQRELEVAGLKEKSGRD